MCLFIHIISMYTHILTIKRNYVNNETHISMIDGFYNEKRHSKKHNGSINTKNHNKKILTFFFKTIQE